MFWPNLGCRININPQIGAAENLYDFRLVVTPVILPTLTLLVAKADIKATLS